MEEKKTEKALVMTFTKKPVTIQAIQYNNLNRKEVELFVGKKLKTELESETAYLAGKGSPKFSLIIETKEGEMKAMPGDWIIKEPFPTGDRDFYPCKKSIFEKTYNEKLQAETPQEYVLSVSITLWNSFLNIPKEEIHPDDINDVRFHLHAIQNILYTQLYKKNPQP